MMNHHCCGGCKRQFDGWSGRFSRSPERRSRLSQRDADVTGSLDAVVRLTG